MKLQPEILLQMFNTICNMCCQNGCHLILRRDRALDAVQGTAENQDPSVCMYSRQDMNTLDIAAEGFPQSKFEPVSTVMPIR